MIYTTEIWGTLHNRVANLSLAAACVAVVVSHSPRFDGNTHNAGVPTYLGFRKDVRCWGMTVDRTGVSFIIFSATNRSPLRSYRTSACYGVRCCVKPAVEIWRGPQLSILWGISLTVSWLQQSNLTHQGILLITYDTMCREQATKIQS